MDKLDDNNLKLKIELVPQSCWYSNVRSNVSQSEWDVLRKKSYKLANYKCEICSGTGLEQGFRHPVECHEEWTYVDGVQKLVKLISLCPYCHKCKHPGLANIKGESHIVLKQLMNVNNMTQDEANEYLNSAFDLWKERSRKEWKLDISYIEEFKKD